MKRVSSKKSLGEYKNIMELVLKGFTISEIANHLNYSTSTVSNRLNVLFEKYRASSRLELVANFFKEKVDLKQNKLNQSTKKLFVLKQNISDLIRIINQISDNSSDKKELSRWINIGKDYINKITY